MTERTHSRSELVIDSLMAKLTEVRTIEESEPAEVKHEFGNLEDAKGSRPPRVVWLHRAGIALTNDVKPATEGDPPIAGTRVARYTARIWMRDVESCENLLDQLVTASKMLPQNLVSFRNQPYEFPTQVEGRWLESGQLIDATVLVSANVFNEPRGATELVEVQSSQLRAGIENPIGEDPDDEDAEYDVNRWTG